MQSTGQTSTQELSFCPMHGSAITYAMGPGPLFLVQGAGGADSMETWVRAAAHRRHGARRLRPAAAPDRGAGARALPGARSAAARARARPRPDRARRPLGSAVV